MAPLLARINRPYALIPLEGNLEDLISLEKTIWKRFPEVNGMHYLFLVHSLFCFQLTGTHSFYHNREIM